MCHVWNFCTSLLIKTAMVSRAKHVRIETMNMEAILDYALADENSSEDLESDSVGISSGEEIVLDQELYHERIDEIRKLWYVRNHVLLNCTQILLLLPPRA